jgi:hypothetical protein
MRYTGLAAALALTTILGVSAFSQDKRNERRTGEVRSESPSAVGDAEFEYEFSHPEFTVRRMTVRHDGDGRGTVSFERRELSEAVTEPLRVSAAALGRIKSSLEALDFLRSVADYQHPKDFTHLGTAVFTQSSGGVRRSVRINYTENKSMRAVLDEYRKIGQQTMWVFEMTLARDTQPLDTPAKIDVLDGYLKRGEISDPAQLVPFLRELTLDERLPLIARNKTARIVRRIETERR